MPNVDLSLNELCDLHDALVSHLKVVKEREKDLRLCFGGEYYEDVIERLRQKVRLVCIEEMNKDGGY